MDNLLEAVEALIAKAAGSQQQSDPWHIVGKLPKGLNQAEQRLWQSGICSADFVSSERLCQQCAGVRLLPYHPLPHHGIRALKCHALLGCLLCRMSFELYADLNPDDWVCEIKYLIYEHKLVEMMIVDLGTNTLMLTINGAKLPFELFTRAKPYELSLDGSMHRTKRLNDLGPSPMKEIFLREMPQDPAGMSCGNLAKKWLRDCLSEHVSCSQDATFKMPSRVIDISGKEPRLRTLDQKGVPYITLSHCWGAAPPLTTTKDNLGDHQQQIELSKMPLTFRDAIAVAKCLKVDFIWIDSLCIIQDSIEDWTAECSKMGDYYRNSHLTVSALDSRSSHEGFLNKREAQDFVELSKDTGLCIRRGGAPYQKLIQNAPLSQRGWALQERLLTRRVLHYGKNEMFWECLNCVERERSTKGYQYILDMHSFTHTSDGEDLKRAMFSIDGDPFALYRGAYSRWYQIVSEFSRRSLTYASDTLPAIAGLAAMISQKSGSQYMLGLWEEDVHGLVWCMDFTYRGISHIDKARQQGLGKIPSWAWVGANRSVRYCFNDEKRTSSKRDAEIARKFNGSGCITLKALSMPVVCVPAWLRSTEFVPTRRNVIIRCIGREDLDRDGLVLDIYDQQGDKVGVGSFDNPANEETLHDCKAIWIGERVHEEEDPIPVVYFLLIVTSGLTGKWKRVGMGVTRDIFAIWPWRFYNDAFKGGQWEEIVLR